MNNFEEELNNNIKNHTFSVLEINNLVKEIFDTSPFFKSLKVKGEISNWKGKNISGHIYFSLKDSSSTIKCVMFKYDAFSLKEDFKDGDEVILTCSLSVYANGGYYQLIVKNISREGEGDILLKKQKLIEKLSKEGLFDESRKKKLPLFPYKIGIIVGKNSAASKDLETNIIRRWTLVEINFYYSLVQGKEAPLDLIKNIIKADNDNNDVLIIARGGGSIEDLSCFDDEELIRTIAKIKTPLISAVGHEINRSITDFIADKYASTPTGAAEIVVPNKEDVLNDLKQNKDYINTLMNNFLSNYIHKLTILKTNKSLTSLDKIYDAYFEKITNYEIKITNLFKNYIYNLDNKINNYKILADSSNPYNILNKGYCIIKDENDEIIYESKLLKDEGNNKIIFKDKEVDVSITKKEKLKNGK